MEARMRIDPAVRQMTWYITVFVILLSVLMELVFLLLHRWDYTVLLGNLLGAAIAIVNFFLMGLAVQKAVDQEEKEARSTIRVSQSLRTMMVFITAGIGVLLSCFHVIAVILPLLFPRIAIAFRPLYEKLHSNKEG